MVKQRDNNGGGPPANADAERLSSLDAMRGFVLFLFISSGFGLKQMLADERWRWLTKQTAETEWAGFTVADLLYPAMVFIAGVALAHSYAARQAKGHLWIRQLGHAIFRAAVLIALGVYLDSYFARPEPHFVFDLRGELQQLGMAYLLAFLIAGLGMAAQGLAVAFLLVGHTAAYVIYSVASTSALWTNGNNLGVAIDHWLQFGPRDGIVTFNVVSATTIMLTGVLVGGLARTQLTPGAKVAITSGVSLVCLLFGWALSGGGGIGPEFFTVVPMIAKLGTLTYVFTAVGWSLLIFTYFYLVMDGLLLRFWALPIAILGRNPLVLFVVYQFSHGWAETTAKIGLPSSPSWALTLQPLFVSLIVLLIYWLLGFWMYRRRIFVKV